MRRSAAPPCRFATSASAHIRSLPRSSFTRTARLNRLSVDRIDSTALEAVGARAIMQRQVAQLVRLVDDLLDVSRITRGRLDLRRQRVELANVMRAAVETCAP